MTVCVFVTYHQPAALLQNRCLVPVLLGKNFAASETLMVGDNCGENISDKYPFFGELTALYNLWKTNTSNYKGLLSFSHLLNLKNGEQFFHRVGKNFLKQHGLTDEKILATCSQYDIILPNKTKRMKYAFSVGEAYKKEHSGEDLDICMQVIRKHYPEMYDIALKILAEKQLYPANILIAKQEIFDAYCQWLFTVLFAVSGKIQTDLEKRKSEQRSAYRFLAEILLNVYITDLKRKNTELKIKTYPSLRYEPSKREWHRYQLKKWYFFWRFVN